VTDTPSPPASHGFQIGQLLRRAYAHAKKHSSAQLSELGELTPVQASAILALESRPLSQAELGRRIDMEPANVHSFVRRLEAARLTTIEPGSGRRSCIVLTDNGRRIASHVRESARRSADATLARLDPDERETLARLLAKLLS
jgi:DNA-binding MarR family transcriptional regulator